MKKNKKHSTLKRLQIIFSITRNCCFTCRFCSMNAGPNYITADKHLLDICRNLRSLIDRTGRRADIDISGGEPLLADVLPFTFKCLDILGSERCSISTTGITLNQDLLNQLGSIAGIDFTMDSSPDAIRSDRRPAGYHAAARKAIPLCTANNIPVSVCTVLHAHTANAENLRGIQKFLDDTGVSSWVWLPLYPIGRASTVSPEWFEYPDPHELKFSLYSDMIQPKLQHTLTEDCDCHAFTDVVYVSPEGLTAACPWALQSDGKPHPDFVIGNLRHRPRISTSYRKPSRCPSQWVSGNSPTYPAGSHPYPFFQEVV